MIDANKIHTFPSVPPKPWGTMYLPDSSFYETEVDLLDIEKRSMEVCLALGEQALLDDNLPIGAVIIEHKKGLSWSAYTRDNKTHNLFDHAEVIALMKCQQDIDDDLSNCSLITSVEPCTSCLPHFAEGKIGRIIYALPRGLVLETTGKMRQRKRNMHEMLEDGQTTTKVIGGYLAERAIESFLVWSALNKRGVAEIPQS